MHSFSQNVFGKRKKRKEKKTALFNSSFFAIRFLPAEYFRSCCFVFAVIFSPPPPRPAGFPQTIYYAICMEYHLPQGQNTNSMGGGVSFVFLVSPFLNGYTSIWMFVLLNPFTGKLISFNFLLTHGLWSP